MKTSKHPRFAVTAGNASVLTIQDLSIYLKIPISTLYKFVREGTVPSQKVGRHWRFHKDAVDDWLKHDSTKTAKHR